MDNDLLGHWTGEKKLTTTGSLDKVENFIRPLKKEFCASKT